MSHLQLVNSLFIACHIENKSTTTHFTWCWSSLEMYFLWVVCLMCVGRLRVENACGLDTCGLQVAGWVARLPVGCPSACPGTVEKKKGRSCDHTQNNISHLQLIQ